MTHSLYYGRPVSANAFRGYSDNELYDDLEAASIDPATKAAIEAELERRVANRTRSRRRRES